MWQGSGGHVWALRPSQRPHSGATNTTNSLFGKPATTSTGFGSGATSSLFGAKPAFGAPSAVRQPTASTSTRLGPFPPPPQTGTAQPPYQPTWQQDPRRRPRKTARRICSTPSPPWTLTRAQAGRELRALDYQQGRKDASSSQQAAPCGGFGAPAAGGLRPACRYEHVSALRPTSSPFGAPKPASLRQQTTPTTTFGQQPASTGFGAAATNTGGGLFGQQPQQQPAIWRNVRSGSDQQHLDTVCYRPRPSKTNKRAEDSLAALARLPVAGSLARTIAATAAACADGGFGFADGQARVWLDSTDNDVWPAGRIDRHEPVWAACTEHGDQHRLQLWDRRSHTAAQQQQPATGRRLFGGGG